MSDSYTTVTSQNIFQRIGSSLFAVLLGPIFIIGAAVLLFFNEVHAVRNANSLKEGAATVLEADSAHVDAADEGKLVHLAGMTKTETPLTDPAFGVTYSGVRLDRAVEVYEWTESSHSSTTTSITGTKTTTTQYDYKKQWQNALIDTSRFHEKEGHENPSSLAYPAKTFKAESVALGAFELDSALAAKITGDEQVPLAADSLKLPAGARLDSGGSIYVGANPEVPAVGDLKITEKGTPNTTVSVVAAQVGAKLTSYKTSNGGTIALLVQGSQSAAQMFQAAQSSNKTLAWVLRGVGFVLLFIGIHLIFGPLSTLASFVPLLGAVFEGGLFMVSFLMALIGWFLLVGAAWMAARPLVAVPLFIFGFLALATLIWLLVKRHASRKLRLAGTAPGTV